MSFNRPADTANNKRKREEVSDLDSHKKARKDTANISTSSSSAQVILEPPHETIHRDFRTILALNKEVAACKDRIIKLSAENDELNDELVDNVQYLDTAEAANISLRYELANYEIKLKEYEAAFAAQQNRINNQGIILNNIVNASTAEISALKREIAELTSTAGISALKREIAELKRENTQLKIVNVRPSQQQLEELQKTFTAFRNYYNLQINSKDAENARLKAQLERAQAGDVKPQRPVLSQSAQMGMLTFTPSTAAEQSPQPNQTPFSSYWLLNPPPSSTPSRTPLSGTPMNGSQGMRRSNGGNPQ